MKKILFYIFYILFLMSIFIFSFTIKSFAAYPKLVSTLVDAFEEIKGWLIAISTPAVAVAVRYRSIYEKI